MMSLSLQTHWRVLPCACCTHGLKLGQRVYCLHFYSWLGFPLLSVPTVLTGKPHHNGNSQVPFKLLFRHQVWSWRDWTSIYLTRASSQPLVSPHVYREASVFAACYSRLDFVCIRWLESLLPHSVWDALPSSHHLTLRGVVLGRRFCASPSWGDSAALLTGSRLAPGCQMDNRAI